MGTMTFVQHRIHPTSTASVSSAVFIAGQCCNTYCRIRDNTGSVVVSLIIVAATGPPAGVVERSAHVQILESSQILVAVVCYELIRAVAMVLPQKKPKSQSCQLNQHAPAKDYGICIS